MWQGVSSLLEIPTDSCHFFCTPRNPCATPIVTRREGSFSYQGVSTGGLGTLQVNILQIVNPLRVLFLVCRGPLGRPLPGKLPKKSEKGFPGPLGPKVKEARKESKKNRKRVKNPKKNLKNCHFWLFFEFFRPWGSKLFIAILFLFLLLFVVFASF